jgi:ribosomal-protein-serine acetyltransferase
MLEFELSDSARLRLLEESDAGDLYRVIERNRSYLARWMPWAATQTLADTLEFIRATRRQLAANDGIQTAIIVGGQIAGCVGVHGVAWADRRTSIGYWLAEEYQGHGTMTAAVRAYTDHAFTNWGLIRMELHAAIDNHKSCAVAERLGFHREGVLRDAEIVGGRPHDVAVYAALAREWRAEPYHLAMADGNKDTISLEEAASKTVGDVMISRPKTLPSDALVSDVRLAFERPSIRTVLITDERRFVGAIERGGLPGDAPDEAPARSYVEPAPVTAFPTTPMIDAMRLLEGRDEQRLIVLDEDGRTLRGLLCGNRTASGFCIR